MGIPRLTSHLAPYLDYHVLGCSNPECTIAKDVSPGLIIDGPSLAHHIYHNLLQHSNGSNPLEAQPSYTETGNAVVLFLDKLQECGLEIQKIYFDGFLPIEKRPTRQGRLETGVKKLISLQNCYPNGFKLRQAAAFSDRVPRASALFSPPNGTPHPTTLPTPPFLVPASIERLRRSQYAPTVELVPGEADSFCASAAREHCTASSSAFVLSSDSDLLIHSLGPRGAVAFFGELELLNGCNECDKAAVTVAAMISQRERIAKKLGVKELLRVAFEIKRNPSVTLAEAVVRAKVELGAVERKTYAEFSMEYGVGVVPTSSRVVPQSLDPRLSEFVLQIWNPVASPVHIYMPLLYEDPSRASAWDVLKGLRQVAYTAVFNSSSVRTKRREYVEISRRGFIISQAEYTILSDHDCQEKAELISQKLLLYESKLEKVTTSHSWRAYGMAEVLSWYVESGRNLPGDSAISTALHLSIPTKWWTWQDFQLSAQLQAALYSFRTAKQLLELVERATSSIQMLKRQFSSVPLIDDLVPSRLERKEEMHIHVDQIKAIALGKNGVDEAEGSASALRSAGTTAQSSAFQTVGVDSRRERKRARAAANKEMPGRTNEDKLKKKASNNLYSLLEDT